MGIEALDVFQDHDPDPLFPPGSPPDPGEWVLWASLNNRDREWARLLDRDDDLRGHPQLRRPRPRGRRQPYGPRSLGPHLLVFNPRFGRYFPGLPLSRT